MHAISDYVWAVVDPFEPPKKCKVLDIILPTAYSNTTNTTYILRYKSTDFEVYHLYVYSEKTQAEICWAMEFKSVFDHISKHQKSMIQQNISEVINFLLKYWKNMRAICLIC